MRAILPVRKEAIMYVNLTCILFKIVAAIAFFENLIENCSFLRTVFFAFNVKIFEL